MKSIFKGTGVALVTPFKKDFSIDFQGIEKVVEHVIESKVDYVVALGTTAETPTLSFPERKQILDTIICTVNKRIPIIAGIGCNNPLEVIEQIYFFDLKQVDAILSVVPYYNKPQQEGIVAHYKLIAKETSLPILLYNVPSRVGANIEAATTLRIAKEVPNVIGIKEASGNFSQIMEIICNKPKDFLVLSGDDALTLPLLACGLDGVISVVANAFPKEFSKMVRLALQGEFSQAQKIHYHLYDAMKACFEEGNPSGVKTFMSAQGRIDPYVRLPLVEVSANLFQRINMLNNKMKNDL